MGTATDCNIYIQEFYLRNTSLKSPQVSFTGYYYQLKRQPIHNLFCRFAIRFSSILQKIPCRFNCPTENNIFLLPVTFENKTKSEKKTFKRELTTLTLSGELVTYSVTLPPYGSIILFDQGFNQSLVVSSSPASTPLSMPFWVLAQWAIL